MLNSLISKFFINYPVEELWAALQFLFLSLVDVLSNLVFLLPFSCPLSTSAYKFLERKNTIDVLVLTRRPPTSYSAGFIMKKQGRMPFEAKEEKLNRNPDFVN